MSEAAGTWKRVAKDTMVVTVWALRAFPSTGLAGVRSMGRHWLVMVIPDSEAKEWEYEDGIEKAHLEFISHLGIPGNLKNSHWW